MLTNSTERKMEEVIDSDKTPAMLASTVFYHIINQIQSSNLNFQLQISPYSAKISLKKSLVRDRAGALLLPPDPVMQGYKNDNKIEIILAKNAALEQNLSLLQSNYRKVVDDASKAYETIRILESKLAKVESDALEKFKNDKTVEALQTKINEYELEASDLKLQKEKAFEASARSNKDLNNYKLEISTEISGIQKEHKEEAKAWKKSLEEANEEKMKMQKQLENKLDEEVAAKNDEIRKVTEEKVELERKVNDLLDSLYGCNYCGSQACALECYEYREFLEAENADDEKNDKAGQDTPEQSDHRQNIFPPAIKTSETPSHPPQLSSYSPPPP